MSRRHQEPRDDKQPLSRSPQAQSAHLQVKAAVRSGRLVRPVACEGCGAKDERIEAHHEDYARALDVEWFCRSCHRRADRALRTARIKATRKNPYRETPDVVAAANRLINAVGKRVAGEDPEDLLHLIRLEAELDDAFRIAVAGLRASGYSDGAIGEVCGGITKQAVQQRWPRTPTKEEVT